MIKMDAQRLTVEIEELRAALATAKTDAYRRLLQERLLARTLELAEVTSVRSSAHAD
jgi:hypothetical protein